MWFDSRRWKHNFVLRKRLRLAPGTSEPPVRRVLGRAGKEAKREADHSPMFSKVLKKEEKIYKSASRHDFMECKKTSLVNQHKNFELSSAGPTYVVITLPVETS
jgi:hypothetical protein